MIRRLVATLGSRPSPCVIVKSLPDIARYLKIREM